MELTQVQFAALLKVAPNTVARWERGEISMKPSMALLLKYMAAEVDLTYPNPTESVPTAEPPMAKEV